MNSQSMCLALEDERIAAMTLIGSDKHSHWGSLQRLHLRPQIQKGILDSFGFGFSDCCVMDMRLILNGWWKTQIRRRFAQTWKACPAPLLPRLNLGKSLKGTHGGLKCAVWRR